MAASHIDNRSTVEEIEGLITFDCQVVGERLSEEQREQFYMKMKHVVVNVEVWDTDVYDCQGAGVFISEEGHILTLLHMLKPGKKLEKEKLQVKTNKGDTYKVSLISYKKDLGLAILKVSGQTGSETRYPFAKICTDDLKIGSEIYPIGHPGFLDFSYPIGQISFPCREQNELRESLTKALIKLDRLVKRRKRADLFKVDLSARQICYADELRSLRKLSSSVCFVMVNNVHGDGRGGASGMPFFNIRGEILGIYYLLAYDQCYGIHAKTLHSYVYTVINDTPGDETTLSS